MVDVKFIRRFPRIITLDELRTLENKALAGMQILRTGNRLSITPVEAAHWEAILDIARKASSRQ
jgi:predicted RNA-binding protein with PUA-like domain